MEPRADSHSLARSEAETPAALLALATDDLNHKHYAEAYTKARSAAHKAYELRDSRGVWNAVNFIHEMAPLLEDVILRSEAFETIAIFGPGNSYEEMEAVNAWVTLLITLKREPLSLATRLSIAWRAAGSCEPHFSLHQAARDILKEIRNEVKESRVKKSSRKNGELEKHRLDNGPNRSQGNSGRILHIVPQKTPH